MPHITLRIHSPRIAFLLGLSLALLPGTAQAQFPPDSFTNLQVLPEDIGTRELIGTMRSFALGLGVRCSFCHVGEEGRPLATFDFAADDKAEKLKAREMIRMARSINSEHLASLEERVDPPIEVTCATCHHGVSQPRPIQSILVAAYEEGGLDALNARYHELREEYYGSYSYDFGDFMLIDVGQAVGGIGAAADALEILRLNVEQNPNSMFARNSYINQALEMSFMQGSEAGLAQYEALEGEFGREAFAQGMMNAMGYRFLQRQRAVEAIEIFKLNVSLYPESANAYDSLGEAYIAGGERDLAIEAYEKSLQLDPSNDNAVQKLEELKGN
jgi:tetratricopeptide (TPR) repeat protein